MSKLTTYELEMLNPLELGKLLCDEVRAKSTSMKYIQNLLDVGCPIEARDGAGWAALHYAACDGKLDIVEFLLSQGADIHVRDTLDRTALHYAASNRHLGVVKFLISKGADANARDFIGHTAWVFASAHIREECPELKP